MDRAEGWLGECLSIRQPSLPLEPPLPAPPQAPGATSTLRPCPFRLSWQVAALDLGNAPIKNVAIVLAVVLLGQFVVRRFFKS